MTLIMPKNENTNAIQCFTKKKVIWKLRNVCPTEWWTEFMEVFGVGASSINNRKECLIEAIR